jgi:hypothetical protein
MPEKILNANKKPLAHSIHPIEFSGRRETMSAPTVEVVTTHAPTGKMTIKLPRSWINSKKSAQTAVSAHSNHASHVAARVLFPPPCSLAPSVTVQLYSTTVSKALRNALRGEGEQSRAMTLKSCHADDYDGLLCSGRTNLQ